MHSVTTYVHTSIHSDYSYLALLEFHNTILLISRAMTPGEVEIFAVSTLPVVSVILPSTSALQGMVIPSLLTVLKG